LVCFRAFRRLTTISPTAAAITAEAASTRMGDDADSEPDAAGVLSIEESAVDSASSPSEEDVGSEPDAAGVLSVEER